VSRREVESDDRAAYGETFLERFSRRKQEARQPTAGVEPIAAAGQSTEAVPVTAVAEAPGEAPPDSAAVPPGDADMPPIESLNADSDYTGFLSEKVSETLRKAALRKLFHGSAFNVTDGLDEYADDFTTFEALGDIVTSDMRHLIEVEARKKAALLDALDAEADAADESSEGQGPVAPCSTGKARLDDASARDADEETQPPLRDSIPATIDSQHTDESSCQPNQSLEINTPDDSLKQR
jgi:hypothetical protein